MSAANQYQRPAGATTAIEFAFVFVRWARDRQRPLRPRDLEDRFGMSRATAWRYLRAYRDAQLEDRA
ncbi:hypothetical protein [Stenotrophomonas indicatrix]|uniref:hypothetical protein n=1 Tax=Stenotrophomonas indicatrix TaxID=2045451 RepID=UPI0013137A29|nr:hypothetical protein [Stenotrophomonas indicatrix]